MGYPLAPFQQRIAETMLGGQGEVLILIGRGNAKTSLAAVAPLHRLCSTPQAKV